MFKVLLVVLLILIVLAIKFLPLWGSLLFIAAVFFGGKWLIARSLRNLFVKPFLMKGAVLRGATATVHAITPAPAPEPPSMEALPAVDGVPALASDEDDDEADDEDWDEEYIPEALQEPRDWYTVDVTITPQPTTGEFTLWEPGDLVLVPADAVVRPDLDDEIDEEQAYLYDLLVWEGGAFRVDEAGKYGGEQRLELHVGLTAEAARRQKFRYYFESFGELEFPPAKVSP